MAQMDGSVGFKFNIYLQTHKNVIRGGELEGLSFSGLFLMKGVFLREF